MQQQCEHCAHWTSRWIRWPHRHIVQKSVSLWRGNFYCHWCITVALNKWFRQQGLQMGSMRNKDKPRPFWGKRVD